MWLLFLGVHVTHAGWGWILGPFVCFPRILVSGPSLGHWVNTHTLGSRDILFQREKHYTQIWQSRTGDWVKREKFQRDRYHPPPPNPLAVSVLGAQPNLRLLPSPRGAQVRCLWHLFSEWSPRPQHQITWGWWEMRSVLNPAHPDPQN